MSKFRVGDVVRVKSWDEIKRWEQERGHNVPWDFPTDMKKYCGHSYVIEYVDMMDWDEWDPSMDMSEVQAKYTLKTNSWWWSDPMLELEDENL